MKELLKMYKLFIEKLNKKLSKEGIAAKHYKITETVECIEYQNGSKVVKLVIDTNWYEVLVKKENYLLFYNCESSIEVAKDQFVGLCLVMAN